MPYLVADHLPKERPGARLRKLLAEPGIIRMPGAHNGMAALQARNAGFAGLYLSGARHLADEERHVVDGDDA